MWFVYYGQIPVYTGDKPVKGELGMKWSWGEINTCLENRIDVRKLFSAIPVRVNLKMSDSRIIPKTKRESLLLKATH